MGTRPRECRRRSFQLQSTGFLYFPLFFFFFFSFCSFSFFPQSPLAFETECAWRTSNKFGPLTGPPSADTNLPFATRAAYGLKFIGLWETRGVSRHE